MESGNAQQQIQEPGLRYDGGKTRWDLVPPEFSEVVDVYTMGAAKYAQRNWERGMSWGRVFSSLLRHTWSWWRGEDYDIESGKHHMAHVAWNAITLLTYARRRVGTDDRVKTTTGPAEFPSIKTHEDTSIVS